MSKKWLLILLAVAGVATGYGLMRFWTAPGAALQPEVAPAAVDGAGPILPPVAPPESEQSGGRGSSFSVVGSMSREEMIRRGILPAPSAPDAAAAAPAPTGEGASRFPSPGHEGPPAALQFPPQVAQAAGRYMCLCGCNHRLDQCPCNDQPIGAVTMLTHLQKLLAANPDPEPVDAGMVDRYGEQVRVAPDQP